MYNIDESWVGTKTVPCKLQVFYWDFPILIRQSPLYKWYPIVLCFPLVHQAFPMWFPLDPKQGALCFSWLPLGGDPDLMTGALPLAILGEPSAEGYYKQWMSWHGSTFIITGPLWGESTSYWWIPLTKGKLSGALIMSLLLVWTSCWTNSQ